MATPLTTPIQAEAQTEALARVDVVLVNTEGALNLGSVARLCGNFGCGLRLVDVKADATSREAIMMAHPSEHVLAGAFRYASLADALVGVDLAVGTSSKIVAARDAPALDVARARSLLPSVGARTAFVFGNERTGLLLHEAERCHRVVKLATPGPEPSMNLSHAVAVVLEIVALASTDNADDADDASDAGDARQRNHKERRAGTAAKEPLFREWLSALHGAGYFKANTPDHFAPRLREILDKMDVSERDVELLRGMLRVLSQNSERRERAERGPP